MGEAITKFIAEAVHLSGEMVSDAEKMRIAVTVASVITFEAGVITFGLGILSRALLSRFISAVGIVIFVAQLVPILGLKEVIANAPAAETTLEKLIWFRYT